MKCTHTPTQDSTMFSGRFSPPPLPSHSLCSCSLPYYFCSFLPPPSLTTSSSPPYCMSAYLYSKIYVACFRVLPWPIFSKAFPRTILWSLPCIPIRVQWFAKIILKNIHRKLINIRHKLIFAHIFLGVLLLFSKDLFLYIYICVYIDETAWLFIFSLSQLITQGPHI